MEAIGDREGTADPSIVRQYHIGTRYFISKIFLNGLQGMSMFTQIDLVITWDIMRSQ